MIRFEIITTFCVVGKNKNVSEKIQKMYTCPGVVSTRHEPFRVPGMTEGCDLRVSGLAPGDVRPSSSPW
jgi:hypothetical protein